MRETSAGDWILPESQRKDQSEEEGQEATEEENEEAGQEADEDEEDPGENGRDPDDVLAENVLEALGGEQNVNSVEGCITRLRLHVEDSGEIEDDRLKELGASGVVKRGGIAQVVMGTQSDRIAARINRILKGES